MSTWQPARIATRDYVLRFHAIDPGAISKFAGRIVRVRPADAPVNIRLAHVRQMGCRVKRWVEVNPDDARAMWPEIPLTDLVTICEGFVVTD